MSQAIARILQASDETPREIFRALLPGVLVLASCALVVAGLHLLHGAGMI